MRVTRAEYELAGELRRYLGAEVGIRRSAAAVARELPPVDRRTPRTQEIVRRLMASFVAKGLAAAAPGPRGGEGWALSEKGAALLSRAAGFTEAAAGRARRRPAAVARPTSLVTPVSRLATRVREASSRGLLSSATDNEVVALCAAAVQAVLDLEALDVERWLAEKEGR